MGVHRILHRNFLFAVVPLIFLGALQAQTTFPSSGTGPGVSGTSPVQQNSVPAALSPYPSTIAVSGLTGTVTKVSVQINNYSSSPSDYSLALALVSPTGRKLALVYGAGSGNPISNVNINFDDTGAVLNEGSSGGGCVCPPFTSGTFKPVAWEDFLETTVPFPTIGIPNVPQTAGSATLASVFNGDSPNGTWSLYAANFSTSNTASISGWKITITTANVASSTTTVTSSKPGATSFVNDSVTFTATVISGGSPVTSGTVQFSINGTATGAPVAVNGSGQAALVTSALTEGSDTVSASYTGASFGASSGSIVETVNRHSTISNATATTGTFCDTGAIAIPAPGLPGGPPGTASSPYPSRVFVGQTADPTGPGQPANYSGSLTKVTVDLKNYTQQDQLGANVLLVSPTGAAFDLFSNVGQQGGVAVSNVNVTLDDAAANTVPTTQLTSGTYKPTDIFNTAIGHNDVFPAPAPSSGIGYAAPAGSATFLSQFAGASPNGTWQLFVTDQRSGTGSFAGGWCLNINVSTTAAATVTTLTSSAAGNQNFVDQTVTFTANVKSAGVNVTAGTVTFSENGTQLQAPVTVDGNGNVTFTAFANTLSANTHTITATYNGATNFGPSFKALTETVDKHTVVTGTQYCNPGPVTVPAGSTSTPATPSPVDIYVGSPDSSAPLAGTINHIGVTLNGVTMTFPRDGQSLLVGPNATPGAGPGGTLSDSIDFFSHIPDITFRNVPQNLTFLDSAAGAITTMATGTYKPTSNLGPDTYLAPAPAGPYQYAASNGTATFGSIFANQLPDGKYSFYFGTLDGLWAIAGSGGGNNAVCINFTLNPPVLAITKSHTGSFTQGGTATYTIGVTNNGPGSTAGTVTVTEVPPATGMTLTALSGNNWTCSVATKTCTRSDILAQGSSYDSITATLTVSNTATSPLTNSASVSGGGTTSTVTANDPTTILPAPVLNISKSHIGTFTQGATGVWNLVVSNSAPSSISSGTVTVVDTLPTNYTLASFTGSGWNCSSVTVTVTCTSTQAVAGGSSFPTIALTVNIPATSPTSVTNNAQVSGGGQLNGNVATTFETITVVQAATTIVATAGSGQSATINTAFTTTLKATVTDAGGAAVAGVTVTFTAPASGASGTFANTSNNVTTAVTNAAGLATAAVFTANGTAGGPYTVSASASGVSPNASFSLTNNVGPASTITATAGGGQSAPINTAFTSQLQATVKDAGNNPVPGITVTFTAPASGASGIFTGTGTNVTTAVTNASGVATAAIFTANGTTGGYSVSASAPGVSPNASFSLTNTAGAAASITATAGSGQSAPINTAFTTQLQATVRDAGNNPVSGVTVTFTAPASGASGIFTGTGTNVTTAVTNASGVATAAIYTANGTAGGPYTVSASAPGVSPNAAFSLTNTVGTAASITATAGSGQSAPINTAFTTQLQATVKDAGNNPVSGVTVTFTAPASGASGIFTGTGTNVTTAVTNGSGVATAAIFTANGTAGGYSVSASAPGVSPNAAFSLTNTVGAAASITATAGSGQSAPINTAFTTQLQATVKDAGNNPVSGVTVTFTAPASGASGIFTGTGTNVTTAVTNGSGVATAAIFTANGTAGGYSVSASAPGVSPNAAFSLTNTAGTAASITATAGSGQSAAINTAFTTQLQATVKDAGNNPVSGVTVTFTAPASGASGIFTGTGTNVTTAVTNGSGVATAAIFTANGTAGGPYTVSASAPGVSPNAAFSLTNTAGTAASITATAGSGQSAAINTAFTTQLQATVKDAGNNPVSGVTVTFTAPASGASGIFTGTGTNVTTAVTNGSGVATAAIFTANGTAGGYSISASAPGVSPNAAFSLTNTAGTAASITATAGSGQSAPVNTAFTTQLQATVKDAGNNPVAGVTVTFTAPASGASGIFTGTGTNVTTAVTNGSGVATAAIFTANGTAGGPYTVSASAPGVSPNAAFSLTNIGSAAFITSVNSTTANGTYGAGATIGITVTFNKAVNVTGTPLLALNSAAIASYVSGSGTGTLTFSYTVAAGQNSAHLDYTSSSALTLNGGSITDASATAANLTLPAPGAAGSLSANTNIVIDTVAPTVVAYRVLYGGLSYNLIGSSRTNLPWQITGIQVVFSKAIAAGNVNSLTGVTTTGFAGLGTNTLTWTVSPLVLGSFSTALAGSGPNQLADAAGNPLNSGAGFAQALRVLYGDFNDDGNVSSGDLAGVNAARSAPYNAFADINGNGVVDSADVQIVRTRTGTSLP